MTIGMKIAEERREAKLEGRVEGIAEGIAQGKAEGMAEGREEGREEGRAGFIKNMLDSGKTPEQISEFCGCPIQEVMEVKLK